MSTDGVTRLAANTTQQKNKNNGSEIKFGWHKVDNYSDGDDLTSESSTTLLSPSSIKDRLEVDSAFEGQFMVPAMSPLNYAINPDFWDDHSSRIH